MKEQDSLVLSQESSFPDGYYLPREFPTSRPIKDVSNPREKALVSLPARFDFIGGWTDTPPYPYEKGAAVFNTTMTLSSSPEITNTSSAIDITVTRGEMHIVQNGSLIRRDEHLVIDKVFEYLCLNEPGINLKVDNLIPHGSGLGGSSLLGAAIFSAVVGYYEGIEKAMQNPKEIVNGILTVEQLMGSGGGWQDQIGGILPGLKLITTQPDKAGSYKIKYSENSESILRLNNCSLIIDLKMPRKAAFVLYSIRGKVIEKDPVALAMLKKIKENAEAGFNCFNKGDFLGFACLLSESWDLVNSVESNSRVEVVDLIEKICGKDLVGRKIGGAGGGGFALTIFADHEKREYYRKKLMESLPNGIVYYPFFGGDGAVLSQEGERIKVPKITSI